jgi:hypothetical protein
MYQILQSFYFCAYPNGYGSPPWSPVFRVVIRIWIYNYDVKNVTFIRKLYQLLMFYRMVDRRVVLACIKILVLERWENYKGTFIGEFEVEIWTQNLPGERYQFCPTHI